MSESLESKKNPASVAETATEDMEAPPAAKRARQDDNDNKNNVAEPPKEILDLASKFGYNAGDRLEVAWQLEEEEEPIWWGATLLAWNEQDVVDECVAVRELLYDAFPARGFMEESVEQVVFFGENLMIDLESNEGLSFRRPGEYDFSSNDDCTLVRVDPAKLVEQTLTNVLAEHGEILEQLPASEQAVIAEKIAEKREKLVAHLEAASKSGVVTKSTMQGILTSVWKGEPVKDSEDDK